MLKKCKLQNEGCPMFVTLQVDRLKVEGWSNRPLRSRRKERKEMTGMKKKAYRRL